MKRRWFIGGGIAISLVTLSIVFVRPFDQNILSVGPALVRAMLGVGEFREPRIVRDISSGQGPNRPWIREAIAFESKIVAPGQDTASGVAALLDDGFQERSDLLSKNRLGPAANTKRRIFVANWTTVVCAMYATVELDVLPSGIIQSVSGTSEEVGCL